MTVLICFCSVFGIFLLQSVFGNEDGECYRTVWNEVLKKYNIDHYCCDDYVRMNGTCIECEKGYTSTEGRQCQPCPNDSYGIRCVKSCLCTHIQRCHHVIGCVNLSFTTYRVTKEDFSTSAAVTTTIYETEGKKDDKQNKDLSTSAETTTINQTEGKKDDKQSNELFSQKIVVYTSCIAGLLVVITVCYVCAKRLQNNRTINTHIESNVWNRDHDNSRFVRRDLPNPVFSYRENEVEFENIYDEINENNIKETKDTFECHVNTIEEPTTERSESENEEKLDDDDYLNPYQQMVNDQDNHDYNTAITYTEESMKIKFRHIQEVDIETHSDKSLCSDRHNLENLDQTLLNYSNKCVITNAVHALQLEISNDGALDVLNLKHNSTSMVLLSSKKKSFKDNSSMLSFKRRGSI